MKRPTLETRGSSLIDGASIRMMSNLCRTAASRRNGAFPAPASNSMSRRSAGRDRIFSSGPAARKTFAGGLSSSWAQVRCDPGGQRLITLPSSLASM